MPPRRTRSLRLYLVAALAAAMAVGAGCGTTLSANQELINAYKAGHCALLKVPNTDDPTVNAWNDLCSARHLNGCRTRQFLAQRPLLSGNRRAAFAAADTFDSGIARVAAAKRLLAADDLLASHNDSHPPCNDAAAEVYVLEHHATDALDDAAWGMLAPSGTVDTAEVRRQLAEGTRLLDSAEQELTAVETGSTPRGSGQLSRAEMQRQAAMGYGKHVLALLYRHAGAELRDELVSSQRLHIPPAVMACCLSHAPPAGLLIIARATDAIRVGPTTDGQAWHVALQVRLRLNGATDHGSAEMTVFLQRGAWRWKLPEADYRALATGRLRDRVCPDLPHFK
jgi:hypothetical protein